MYVRGVPSHERIGMSASSNHQIISHTYVIYMAGFSIFASEQQRYLVLLPVIY
jgi:hypothetical protein